MFLERLTSDKRYLDSCVPLTYDANDLKTEA